MVLKITKKKLKQMNIEKFNQAKDLVTEIEEINRLILDSQEAIRSSKQDTSYLVCIYNMIEVRRSSFQKFLLLEIEELEAEKEKLERQFKLI